MGSSSQDLEAELRRLLLSSSSRSGGGAAAGTAAAALPTSSNAAAASSSTMSTTSSGKKIRKRRGKRRPKGNADEAEDEEIEGAEETVDSAAPDILARFGQTYNPEFPGRHPSVGG